MSVDAEAQGRLALIPNRLAQGATITGESVLSRRAEGFAVAVTQRNIAGGTPTWTVKVQHTGDPTTIVDASANWTDLITLGLLTGAGTVVGAHATRHFERVRAIATYGGTGTGDVEVAIQ